VPSFATVLIKKSNTRVRVICVFMFSMPFPCNYNPNSLFRKFMGYLLTCYSTFDWSSFSYI